VGGDYITKKRISINVDHGAPGFLADMVTVSHNKSRFVFDFVQMTPKFDRMQNKMQQSMSVVHNTVIMDPAMAKSILTVLENNFEKYEKAFGEVKASAKIGADAKEIEEELVKYIG